MQTASQKNHNLKLIKEEYYQPRILYPAELSFKNEGEGLPLWSSGKESAFQRRGRGLDPWSGN